MQAAHRIFRAGYSEWRLIKTRGVIQVVFEVPLAQSDEAYQALGGMPNPAEERWFAIAALDPKRPVDAIPVVLDNAEPAPAAVREAVGALDPAASRPRKPVAPEKRLAQQAGIACADPLFRKFIGVESELAAAIHVRELCGVGSRSEIVPRTAPGLMWADTYSRFVAWRDWPEMEEA